MAWYFDTSAAVKLVVAEPGSTALTRWLRTGPKEVASSDLLRTELLRTVRRGAPDRMEQARAVLDGMILLSLPAAVFERAAELAPLKLRTLDAVHLAAALELGDDLEGIVAYDRRLLVAAKQLGITTVGPS